MIGTLNIKPQQLSFGSYKTGTGPEVVLVMGSCRSIPYLNYFHRINPDNRFTVHYIDPFNWCWDANENRVDYQKAIESMEQHPDLLNTLKSVRWFIHEHYQNFGMFNTERSHLKNIYQFGLRPELDISVPNFHDVFILFQDFITFDQELKAEARKDMESSGVLSYGLQDKLVQRGMSNLTKFYNNCALTDFPELAGVFASNWQLIRYFWSFNHVSNRYTMEVFRMMNEKFMHLNLPEDFWRWAMANDMFASGPCTPLTKYDIANWGILWDNPVVDLVV